MLLTATVVLGVVASVGWTTERWPRFLSQNMHRNLSLFCVGFVGIHVVTTVSDGYVPIGFVDAFIPFRTPYRPFYVGLGALSFDLLLAVLVTSALRHRIGFASWRFVHWLAYLCWPIAMFHALGTGSDARLPVVLFVGCVCLAVVAGAFAWRLATGADVPPAGGPPPRWGPWWWAWRCWVRRARTPPAGWSHRSGTSAALLAQLAAQERHGGHRARRPGHGRRPPPRRHRRRLGRPGPGPSVHHQRVGHPDPAPARQPGARSQVILAMHLEDSRLHPADRRR